MPRLEDDLLDEERGVYDANRAEDEALLDEVLGTSAKSELTKAQTRLAHQRADAQEMANAIRRGELVEREAAKLAIQDVLTRAKMVFTALPGRTAPRRTAARARTRAGTRTGARA